MTTSLDDRLNQILPRITSEAFLSSEGIGNEIACYIFDYPAEDELKVREHIEMMLKRLKSHHSDLSVLHLDLLDVVVAYLKKRGLFDKALEMQASDGDTKLLKVLEKLVSGAKIRDFIAAEHRPADHALLLLSGVGSAWPALQAHSLLNCLHTVMGQTPLVMFYPGKYDGTTLRLFGRVVNPSRSGNERYYRALMLIPRGTQS
jgi:hypothetical protein